MIIQKDKANLEILSYNNLKENIDLSESIEKAFGDNGLGIILVKDIPNLELLRETLLKLSKKLASLPINIKEKYTYSNDNCLDEGYRKNLAMNNQESFCANPLYDNIMVNDDLKIKYSKLLSSNIWPDKELPDLKTAFKNLGITMIQVSFWILMQCDKYLHKITNGVHENNTFYHMISNSQVYRGNLLHYSTNEEKKDNDEYNMCINSESLICHVNPMYLSKNDNILHDSDNNFMYIKDKTGRKIKINIPNNCLALQIGETLQILSGGYLKANPYYVKLCQKPQISIEQFTVCVDCFPEQPLELPKYSKTYDEIVNTQYDIDSISNLKDRLKGCTIYYDFVKNTLKSSNMNNI